MNRRLVTVIAVPVLLLAVSACGAGEEDSSSSASKRITLIQGQAGEPFYISMECGAQAAAKAFNINLDVQGPTAFDATLQNPIIDAVTAKKPDALLIAPNDDKASVSPLKAAQDKGIKTILVDTIVSDESIGLSRISSDNEAGGVAAAQELAKQVGDKGSVLFIGTKPGVSSVDARQRGFEKEIKNHAGIKLLAAQFSNNDLAKANQIVSDTLTANPDLAGIFAANLTTADGAAAGLKSTGKSGQVKIVGFDAGPKQVKQLEDGSVQALVVQKPYDMGYKGVEFAVKAIKGEQIAKTLATDFVVATKETINTPEISKYLYKESC